LHACLAARHDDDDGDRSDLHDLAPIEIHRDHPGVDRRGGFLVASHRVRDSSSLWLPIPATLQWQQGKIRPVTDLSIDELSLVDLMGRERRREDDVFVGAYRRPALKTAGLLESTG